jgi:hypothetical protein
VEEEELVMEVKTRLIIEEQHSESKVEEEIEIMHNNKII